MWCITILDDPVVSEQGAEAICLNRREIEARGAEAGTDQAHPAPARFVVASGGDGCRRFMVSCADRPEQGPVFRVGERKLSDHVRMERRGRHRSGPGGLSL